MSQVSKRALKQKRQTSIHEAGATAAPRSPKPGREILTTRLPPAAQVMPPHWHTVSPEPAQGASPAAASASSMFCMPLAKRCSASASCVPAARAPWCQQRFTVTGTGACW